VIIFIFGTTAEAIKLAPIARRLEERGIPYESWLTLQHTDSLRKILRELGFQQPTRIIADGNKGQPIKSKLDVLAWLSTVARWIAKNTRPLRKSLPPGSIIVVHGDTLTTVIGAYVAKRLRIPSAHVEAGLRSGNWRHPFPEELDRRMVGRLATIHYTPSEEATEHLVNRKNVVHTHGNTVIDAVLDQGDAASPDAVPFGVVLLHRFEFISNPQLVDETFATLAAESPYPLRLIVDAYSAQGLQETIAKHGGDKLQAQPKLRHQQFVGLLRSAQFIITDSGGIQAEAALLGIPTLVHRMTTEQREGLGRNIVLSEWKRERLSEFLRDFANYRQEISRPVKSPSDTIVEDLVARGYAG
jgi:UDP-N-acetylglucosamine 2-epimerase (non-hydrolysing)